MSNAYTAASGFLFIRRNVDWIPSNNHGRLTAATFLRQKRMLRTVTALLVAAQLTRADDFLKKLTPKDFKQNSTLPALSVRLNQTMTCAIPLKTIHAQNPARIDPIGLPTHSNNIDKGINHPTPIPACPKSGPKSGQYPLPPL